LFARRWRSSRRCKRRSARKAACNGREFAAVAPVESVASRDKPTSTPTTAFGLRARRRLGERSTLKLITQPPLVRCTVERNTRAFGSEASSRVSLRSDSLQRSGPTLRSNKTWRLSVMRGRWKMTDSWPRPFARKRGNPTLRPAVRPFEKL
jgi:hypothetical protein